jgi:hypothetical protein
MAVDAPEPPGGGVGVMQATIRSMAEQRALRTPALRAAGPDQLNLVEPHEVYTLGLDDLRTTAGLDAARPTAWRYLVRDADRVVAAAESVVDTTTAAHTVVQVNEGPFVAATAAALTAIRGDARIQGEAFTQRLLHVPALHAMAVWLHHDGPDDMLVPLAPFPADIPTGRPLPAAQVLSALSDLAARLPEQPSNGTEGS